MTLTLTFDIKANDWPSAQKWVDDVVAKFIGTSNLAEVDRVYGTFNTYNIDISSYSTAQTTPQAFTVTVTSEFR